MEVTLRRDGRRGHSGKPPRPGSARQRVRRACKEIMEGGTYPTMELLRAALPGVPDTSIGHERWMLLKEIGSVTHGRDVTFDLGKLKSVGGT